MADSLRYFPQLGRRLKTLAVPISSDSEYFKLSFREQIRLIMSTLAWLLILAFFFVPPAQGATGKVTIESGQYLEFQWNDGPSYRTVPKHLPWTKAQIDLAKTAIGKTESQINQKLREPAGSVKLQSSRSGTNFSILSLAAYPEYSAKSRIRELSWFDKSGRLIGKPIDYPFEATAPYALFELPNGECSLKLRSIWEPDTWFQRDCVVTAPSPEDFLRATLINDLYFSSCSRCAFSDVAGLVELALSRHVPFTVKNGVMEFSKALGAQSVTRIPLSGHRAGFSYEVRLNRSKTYAWFESHTPTLNQRLRNAQLLENDGKVYVTFVNPCDTNLEFARC